MVLDNSSRLKDSESFSKVILSLDLSKDDREDCKNCLQTNQKKSTRMEEARSGLQGSGDNTEPSVLLQTGQSNEFIRTRFFCSLSSMYDELWICNELCTVSVLWLIHSHSPAENPNHV